MLKAKHMLNKNWKKAVMIGMMACMLSGCGTSTPKEPVSVPSTESEAAENQVTLEDLKSLVGMKDEETKDLFGGGEENWAEKFYIGRNYKVNLNGEEYEAHTTCGEDGTVESVSVWLVSGERDVTDQETEFWLEQMNEVMESEPTYDGTSSEGGSKNWNWNSNGMAAGMNRMKDILSISFQPAVGELQ